MKQTKQNKLTKHNLNQAKNITGNKTLKVKTKTNTTKQETKQVNKNKLWHTNQEEKKQREQQNTKQEHHQN